MADRVGWLTGTTHKAQGWRDADLSTGRAGDVALEVADDSASITIIRAGVSLDAQTVRLLQPTWPPTRGQESGNVGGEQAEADLIVLGSSSLDIQRGDRFLVDSQLYEVIYVAPDQPDRTEARCRQMQ